VEARSPLGGVSGEWALSSEPVYNPSMQPRLLGLALLVLILSACGGAPQATPTLIKPAQRPTEANLQPETSDTGPTPAPNCVDDAAFVADLTLPDGSEVAPGHNLVKQWAVRNTGTCDWGPDYRLVPILPNPLVGDSPVAVYPARAGAQGVWQVTVHVPESTGEVIGRWRAQNPDGLAFGQEVYVVLEVMPSAGTEPVGASPAP
jgi:hypothetical protein